MDEIVLTTGENPEIIFTTLGGDLRLIGWEKSEFHAASDEGSLDAEQSNGRITVVCQSDCVVRVPRRARLKIQQVGGDAQIKSVEGLAEIESVGGDLVLRQTSTVTVNQVGGDLNAKRISGPLTIKNIGGSISARNVEGEFVAEQVGGDLHLRDVNAGARARAGGDMSFSLSGGAEPRGEFNLEAAGDIHCQIPASLSARFTLQAAGEILVNVPGAQIKGNAGQKVVTLNDGANQFNLRAQGDIALTHHLSGDSEPGRDFGEHWGRWGDEFGQMAEDLAEQFESQIEAQMGRFEKQLAGRLEKVGMMGGAMSMRAEAMADRARHAAERAGEAARRRAEHHAERMRRGGPWNFDFSGPAEAATPPSEPVSDEERLSILRMLEQKKITADEAEQLLAALEGR